MHAIFLLSDTKFMREVNGRLYDYHLRTLWEPLKRIWIWHFLFLILLLSPTTNPLQIFLSYFIFVATSNQWVVHTLFSGMESRLCKVYWHGIHRWPVGGTSVALVLSMCPLRAREILRPSEGGHQLQSAKEWRTCARVQALDSKINTAPMFWCCRISYFCWVTSVPLKIIWLTL